LIAYAVIFAVAIGLRFALLGGSLLDDAQADLALQALNIKNGNSVTLSGEPGYLVLTALQFFIFWRFNFMARFWPAYLVPYLYWSLALSRSAGSNLHALVAAMLAVDPITNRLFPLPQWVYLWQLVACLPGWVFGARKDGYLQAYVLGVLCSVAWNFGRGCWELSFFSW
jgi:hypothetical protein